MISKQSLTNYSRIARFSKRKVRFSLHYVNNRLSQHLSVGTKSTEISTFIYFDLRVERDCLSTYEILVPLGFEQPTDKRTQRHEDIPLIINAIWFWCHAIEWSPSHVTQASSEGCWGDGDMAVQKF